MRTLLTICGTAILAAAAPAVLAQDTATTLPEISDDPLAEDGTDPLLALGEQSGDREAFRSAIASAIETNAQVRYADAMMRSVDAAKDEALAGYIPDVQLGLSGRQRLAARFSGADGIDYERTRSNSRTDATFRINQTLFDFGATPSRVQAAGQRLRAASYDVDATREQVAMQAIAAWYDVFAYRALVALSDAFVRDQEGFLGSLRERISQGVAAEGDIARVRSSLALARSSRARFVREAAAAQARFEELTGAPAPQGLQRAPAPQVPAITAEMAAFLARRSPTVLAAEAEARAARQDAQVAKGETLPVLEGGIEGGRYGVFEDRYDGAYDVRATFGIRQSFFTGEFARARKADALAEAYSARADAASDQAAREAAVAWADVDALGAELDALAENYVASRQTRDVLAERFRASRGNLFDVLQAQDTFFSIATQYVQTLTERDAARYVLLAKTGRLLEALDLERVGEVAEEASAGDYLP